VSGLVLQKKLSLILDLDQTILHAELITNADPDTKIPDNLPNLYNFSSGNENYSYLVKFRPGVKEFFVEVSKLYEITVYTAGQHSYALSIVKLVRDEILRDLPEEERLRIIPDRRIISRDKSGNGSFKDLRKIFPHDQSLVVILDDRKDVWPGCEESLINIRRCMLETESPSPVFFFFFETPQLFPSFPSDAIG
jgi:RNA polymerase II subunit A C-terminal domain phosphatase